MTPEQRQAVVAEARSWIGTPYHHMADIKGGGVDCLMLLVRVYAALGLVPAIDPRPYPVDWHMHRSEERYLMGLEQFCEPTNVPQPGDIAMFSYGRTVSHAGIVVGEGLVVHAWIDHRAVVETDLTVTDYLRKRLRGHYTLKTLKGGA